LTKYERCIYQVNPAGSGWQVRGDHVFGGAMVMALQHETIEQASSLPETLFTTARKYAIHPAQWERGRDGYVPVTYNHLEQRVRHVASALLGLGVQAGDRVALLMENCPEWAVADYAILSVGAVTVPLYCTYREQDMVHVLNDSEPVLVLASGGRKLQHLLAAVELCSSVRAVYALDAGKDAGSALPFTDLEEVACDDEGINSRMQDLSRDSLATLIYTSGTTGKPKGVMLSHGNILSNIVAILQVIDLGPGDKMLSFLPLAHVFERVGGHFLPYSIGLPVAFAERPDTVAKNMPEARPTMLISVPRLFEVIRSRILGQVAKQPGISRFLFSLYMTRSGQQRRDEIGLAGRVQLNILDRLVGKKVRDRFGGCLKMFISGGAPLSVEVANFFADVGIPIVEGYGMTESSPVISVNMDSSRHPGSVGKAMKNLAVKLADDGEILVSGPSVMQGYWRLPEATVETIDDGWLHTGDIGVIDGGGYLSITDRKKDLIVNSGGENIAPQRIEGLLVGDELIEQVVVFGDKRPYLVAIVVPGREAAELWATETGMPETGWDQLASSPVFRKALQTRIAAILHPLSQFEQVRRIHVQAEPFSIEEGFLTPTMKIKRRRVYEHFRNIFEGLYS